jgi:hypothetical protein
MRCPIPSKVPVHPSVLLVLLLVPAPVVLALPAQSAAQWRSSLLDGPTGFVV